MEFLWDRLVADLGATFEKGQFCIFLKFSYCLFVFASDAEHVLDKVTILRINHSVNEASSPTV